MLPRVYKPFIGFKIFENTSLLDADEGCGPGM
jgi:hypothetical protein